MADHSIVIAVSAFSGLAGAILTQLFNGLFTYLNDRRKYHHEVHQNLSSRKTEIGENFYFMTGERMTHIQKSIRYWKNWNGTRSESSLAWLKKELTEMVGRMEELNADNWKYNLAGLYFNISFTHDQVIAANAISHQHYLKVLDIGDRLTKAAAEDKEELYKQYALAIFDMCGHYEQVYKLMEHDMEVVKEELLTGYAVG